jgi:hypothetical protein
VNEFLQRLKERKLVQWTLAYVAAAFAISTDPSVSQKGFK